MRASALKAIRLTHLYSGVFLAPAILFFSITGGLQMFSLHETTRGSSYVPPKILVHLAQLHKKGTLTVAPRRLAPPAPPVPATSAKPESPKPSGPEGRSPLPFKIFAALTALGLVVSTLSGMVMSWKYSRRKRWIAATFIAGIVIPLLLLLV